MDENQLILSRLNDLAQQREKYSYTAFSKFVSVKEQQMAGRFKDVCMQGGYPDAERKVIAFYPDYMACDAIEWPIAAIRIAATGEGTLTHRDYLGSLLGLGIKREMLGDIVAEPSVAVLFCLESIAEFVVQNLKSVARSSVTCGQADIQGLVLPEKKFIEITASIASPRLDSVVSAAVGKSRGVSQELVQAGAVQVNYTETSDVSRVVRPGDVLSIRGQGKYIFDGCLHQSKKGRDIVRLRKYD